MTFIEDSSDLGPSKSEILIPTLASLENKPGSGLSLFLTVLILFEHASKKKDILINKI